MTPAYSPSHRDDAPRAWFELWFRKRLDGGHRRLERVSTPSASAWLCPRCSDASAQRRESRLANAVCPSAPTSATPPSPTGTPGRAYTNRLCPYPLAERDSLSRQRRCAAESRDELAPFHSMTSSARNRKDSGMLNPMALAVFRLTTNSNLTGSSTGRSVGLVPFKILCTYSAPRRNRSGRFAP